jgi:hypothetical protein
MLMSAIRDFGLMVGAAMLGGGLASACGSSSPGSTLPQGTAASGGAAASGGTGGMVLTTGGTGGETGGGGSGGTYVPFCEGSGPPIAIPSLGDCTGDVAKTLFVFGICSCGDITAFNTVATDSFDSSEGPDPKVKANGSVGVNGTYQGTSPVTVNGALWVGGTASWPNQHEIDGEVHCGAKLSVAAPSHVHHDLFGAADIAGGGVLTIDGKLHITPGKVHQGVTAKQGVVEEQVTVPPPCDCSKPLDIPGIVAEFAKKNDNESQQLDPAALTEIVDPVTISLPCGRYYLDEVTPLGANVTIALDGRTALFVAGDFAPTGPLTITLGPDAELDLFIAGDLSIGNDFAIGDPARAARTRVYVGGTSKLASPTSFAGNLYLPNATLQVLNELEVWGALFVGGLNVTSPLSVHYDEAILAIDGCPDPDKQCGDCHDCSNPTPACKNDVCAKCESTADCCPPLSCAADGTCKLQDPK